VLLQTKPILTQLGDNVLRSWCLNPDCHFFWDVEDTDEAVDLCPVCDCVALIYTDGYVPEFIREKRENAYSDSDPTAE
jgi:hypothetical protein